jgi:hypothetical protein
MLVLLMVGNINYEGAMTINGVITFPDNVT